MKVAVAVGVLGEEPPLVAKPSTSLAPSQKVLLLTLEKRVKQTDAMQRNLALATAAVKQRERVRS